ncbi:MAG: hypothetical protein A3F11_06490 [Gammaproteobacteria bacterium RIFCSPHIGHO2_12_FULL_37_14]|nr:MAG: hypothetical protein A3F11_06490 [Gammaproteobacteria bacterium RIFCSPHIGHO2_12_FULL_37_14]
MKRTLSIRLAHAVASQAVKDAEQILKQGADANQASILKDAIDHANQAIVKKIADKNTTSPQNESANEPALKILKLLLDYNANPLEEYNSFKVKYDNALAYTVGSDYSFECFKLLFDKAIQCGSLSNDLLLLASYTYDSHIILFLIDKGFYQDCAHRALTQRLYSFFEDPENASNYALTPFFQSTLALYNLVIKFNLPKPNLVTLKNLLKLAIAHQDFAFILTIMRRPDTQQNDALYQEDIESLVSLFFSHINNKSTPRDLTDHQVSILQLLAKIPSWIRKVLTSPNYINIQSILGNTSSHYSLQPPEKLSLISLDAFTHLAVNYIRNNKFNLLLFPLADNELSTIIVYLIFEGYLKTVMEQKVILEHALMHRSTPSKEKFYEWHRKAWAMTFQEIPVYRPDQLKHLVDLIASLDITNLHEQFHILHLEKVIKLWKSNYLPTQQQATYLCNQQLIIKDDTFWLNFLAHVIKLRHEHLCNYILTLDFIQSKIVSEHSVQWLEDFLQGTSTSYQNLFLLGNNDREWFELYLFFHCTKRHELTYISSLTNRITIIDQYFTTNGKKKLTNQLSESKKKLFLTALNYKLCQTTIKKHDHSALSNLPFRELSVLNYKLLIDELQHMALLPENLRKPFIEKKGYYTLMNVTKPQILTPQEKLAYRTLMNCDWEIRHGLDSPTDLEKIQACGMIYAPLARKAKKIPVNHQRTPPDDKDLSAQIFGTIAPKKASAPGFLRKGAAISFNVKALLAVYPDFFDHAHISFHWRAFADNQLFNPTNYADSWSFISHEDNYRYTKYIIDNDTQYVEKKSFAQGFYSGRRLLHILSLLFILTARYVGGKFYQNIIDHPDDSELLSNSFSELLHPGIIEFKYFLAIPLDNRYTKIIPPPTKIHATETRIQTALQDIHSLKRAIDVGFDLNQDVEIKFNGYRYIGTLLARAIAEKQSEAMINLILQHSTAECLLDTFHVNTLYLMLLAYPNIKLNEKILTHRFPITTLPHCGRLLLPRFELLNLIPNIFSMPNLVHVLQFATEPLLTKMLEKAIGRYIPGDIEFVKFLLKNGADPSAKYIFITAIDKDSIELVNLFFKYQPNLISQVMKQPLFITELASINVMVMFDLLLEHMSQELLATYPLLELPILLSIENKTSFLKKILKKLYQEHSCLIDLATDEELMLLTIKNLPQLENDWEKIAIDINDYLIRNQNIDENQFNPEGLKRLLALLPNHKNLLWTLCEQNDLFHLLTFLPESNIRPIHRLINDRLNASANDKWSSLGNLLSAMSDYEPMPLLGEMDDLYHAALLLSASGFHEAIPILIEPFHEEFSLTNCNANIIMTFCELMLKTTLNNTAVVFQEAFFVELEVLESLVEISKHTQHLPEAKAHRFFLLIANYFLMIIEDTPTLNEATQYFSTYIKQNQALFNQLEKHLHIPAFTINKLKILFHEIDATIFPLPVLSTANTVWKAMTTHTLTKTDMEKNKFWYDFYTTPGVDDRQRKQKVGVGMITCFIKQKKCIYLGRKKSSIHFPLIAPGGFINENEKVFMGLLRELREETQLNMQGWTNKNNEILKLDISLLEALDRLDLDYHQNGINHALIIRQLYHYQYLDNFNSTKVATNYSIYFYWLDFDADLSGQLHPHDDFSDGRWVPLNEIYLKDEKYYYNNEQIATSNALLIQRMQGYPIPIDTIRETIYLERSQWHQQRATLGLFDSHANQSRQITPHPLPATNKATMR